MSSTQYSIFVSVDGRTLQSHDDAKVNISRCGSDAVLEFCRNMKSLTTDEVITDV